MSLILDALRKADAERERGSVPGLRSQPVVPLSEAAAAARAPSRAGWLWAAAGVAVGIALIATWIVASRTAQPRVDAAPVAAPLAAPAAPAAPAANRGVDAVAPAATLPSTPAGGQAAAAPTQVAEPAPWTRPGEPAGAATADARAPRAAGTAAADAPVYPHDLLPSHVRSALPQLAISGSIYSPDPAGRSLIVNGRLVRERQRLTPELALEEIRPKSAIFGFRGYRFEVVF